MKDGKVIDFYHIWMIATYRIISNIMDLYQIERTEKNTESIMRGLGIMDGKIDDKGPLVNMNYEEIAEEIQPIMEQLAGINIDCKELNIYLAVGYLHEVYEKIG